MRAKSAQGFTYVWALFAVAFAGVAMMLTTELWQTTVKRERERMLIHVGRQFRDAIGRYYEETPGQPKQYPPSLEDLLKDPRFPAVRRHLRKIFRDPMTGKTEWGLVRLGGRIVGVYSLSDDSPIKAAEFEPSEAGFQGREKYSDWKFTYPHNFLVQAAGNGKANAISTGVSGDTNESNRH